MLIELFISDSIIIEEIDKYIMKYLENNEKNEKILETIIIKEKFSRGDICIFDIIKNVIIRNYINIFKILYVELEKNYFFSSLIKRKNYFLNESDKGEIRDNLEEFNKEMIQIFIDEIKINNNELEYENFDIYFDYNLPLKSLLKQIHDFIQNNVVENYEKISNI